MPYSKEDIKRILGPTPFKESEDSIVVELPTEKYRNPEGKKRVTFVFDCKIPQLFRVYAKNAYVVSADQYDAITAYCLIESQHRHFFVKWAIDQSTGELQPKIEYMLMDNRLTDKQGLRITAVLMGIIENTYGEISNICNPNQAVVDEDKGLPVLRVREGMSNDQKAYLNRWQCKSRTYNRRVGVTAFIPSFFSDIDQSCPSWTRQELESIERSVIEKKVIPVLSYAPEALLNAEKQAWWLVPFCIWREDTASWVSINKNGFWGPHPEREEDNIALIFTWDAIESIAGEFIEDAVYQLTLTGNGKRLTFSEFVPEGRGIYLKVVEAIHEVYAPVIEASRDMSIWVHGAGGERYVSFEQSDQLLLDAAWEEGWNPNSAVNQILYPSVSTTSPESSTEKPVEEESTSVVKEANQDSVESENSGQESGNAQAIPYLSHDTNPAYPGDHYFVTPYYESSLLRVKNFPAVSDANRLFRRFSTEQVEAISSKIRSTETLPVLVFVREILGEYFQYLPSGADPEQNEDFAAIEELKPPFWFLPFCAIGQSFGGILYLEQNGLYSNGARPFLLSSMFPAEKIQRIEWQDGNYETEAEGSAGTLIVSNDEDDVELYLEEFHGNDYGSQLKIVDACLEVWMKVVEKSRKSSFYVLNSVNFIEVHSWDELLEWSQPTSSTIEPINKLDSDSKQMRVEKIRAYLSEEGYAPRVDEDGDLIFKFEESTYMILFDEQDEQFYRIIYPNFWSIDNDSERIKAVKACEAVTGKIKVAKVFTVKNNIWASVELFMGSPEQLILVFKRSLNALRTSVQNFREVMQS